MRLILEATVAGKSEVLGDGWVRVHVTEQGSGSGATVGRLSVTVELWEWVKLWAAEAVAAGWEIEIREREYKPLESSRPQTMRGRLIEAAEMAAERARLPQDVLGVGKGAADGQTPQDGVRSGQIRPLWREVQERKSRKRRK